MERSPLISPVTPRSRLHINFHTNLTGAFDWERSLKKGGCHRNFHTNLTGKNDWREASSRSRRSRSREKRTAGRLKGGLHGSYSTVIAREDGEWRDGQGRREGSEPTARGGTGAGRGRGRQSGRRGATVAARFKQRPRERERRGLPLCSRCPVVTILTFGLWLFVANAARRSACGPRCPVQAGAGRRRRSREDDLRQEALDRRVREEVCR